MNGAAGEWARSLRVVFSPHASRAARRSDETPRPAEPLDVGRQRVAELDRRAHDQAVRVADQKHPCWKARVRGMLRAPGDPVRVAARGP